MKKLLLIASILTLVVFAFAAEGRNMYWQLATSSPAEDIMTYVTANIPEHDTDFLLEVECDAYPGEIYSSADMGPVSPQIGIVYGMFAMARVDQQVWIEDWPAGSTLTLSLTYIPTGFTMTNTYEVDPGSAAIWIGDDMGNGASWDITDIVLDDEPEPEDIYWLRILSMGLDEPGTLLKDGVVIGNTPYMPETSTDKSDFYGIYTMQDVEGGTWTPTELVIDEDTEWPAIPGMDDNYQIMVTFEWEEDDVPDPPEYNVFFSTNPAGYITPEMLGPVEDPAELYGTYTPDPLPAPHTGYWVPENFVIDENTEWTADDGDFVLFVDFEWTETVQYIDVYHYTLYVEASDGESYPVTGPYPGTTPYNVEEDNPEAFYGDYEIGETPSGCYWENPIVTIDENTVWEEVRAAKGGVGRADEEVHHYYKHTITFNKKEYNSFVIVAVDGDTDLRIEGAAVMYNGEQVGTTNAQGEVTFLCPGDYPGAGTYWVEMEGYCEWDPQHVEREEEFLTTNIVSVFTGTPCPEEEPVPVELSSFTATLTGDFFVNIAWTSQTETQMMGYRVYRNTSADQSSAMLVDHPMVPATNTSESQTYNVVDNDVMVGETYYYWLEAVEYNASNYHGPVSVTVTGNVPPVLPEVTSMKNAYPNPFKAGSSTNIEVSLKAGETGSLTIYNVMGQVVRTVSLNEGSHTISWNGRDSKGTAVGSGIYFYKLSTPSLNQTKKMVIVK